MCQIQKKKICTMPPAPAPAPPALGFPTGRDSATFRDSGTEVPSLSRDKGTTGQAQNLARGRDSLSISGTRDRTGQSLFFFLKMA